MENLIATLMVWIGTHTSYNVGDIPSPEVRLVSPAEMTQEYYSGTDISVPVSGGIDSRIYALYNNEDADNGIIFLIDPRLNDELESESADDTSLRDLTRPLHNDWLENPVFQEQLLHELIHHVQFQSGAAEQFKCPSAGEKEAYFLGGQYLRLRHATDPLPNRYLLAHIYSRC